MQPAIIGQGSPATKYHRPKPRHFTALRNYLKDWAVCLHSERPDSAALGLRNMNDYVDNSLHRFRADNSHLQRLFAPSQLNPGSHVLHGFKQYQPPVIRQITIDCSDFAPKYAVNRDLQGSCLTVHRPAAAYHQIRKPD